MTKVAVAGFSISLDGYGAGPAQSLADPLGKGGEDLHPWLFEAADATDADFRQRMIDGAGAFVMGRNMFGPVRGHWPDEEWKGWWGDNPPYHAPTFVLTHHDRAAVEMEGGTTFHFVTGEIEDALYRARTAAGDGEVRICGGASTVRQYLQAGLIDRIHVAVIPIVLGSGEALFAGIDLPALGFRVIERALSANAMHVVLER